MFKCLNNIYGEYLKLFNCFIISIVKSIKMFEITLSIVSPAVLLFAN